MACSSMTPSTAFRSKRGLDLQGGMHLALEVDESKGAVADKAEPSIARSRSCAIASTSSACPSRSCSRRQRPHHRRASRHRRPASAPSRSSQKAAFLQFRSPTRRKALERALPRLDQIAKDSSGRRRRTPTPLAAIRPRASQSGLEKLFTQGHRRPRRRDSATGRFGARR